MLYLVRMRFFFIDLFRKYFFLKNKGSCEDLLNLNPYGISEQLIAYIIWQILQALRYLHDRHIMHR